MSFSTVYDALATAVGALTGFSSKTILPNPYALEDNPEGFLRNGWGLTVGGSATGSAEFNSTVDVHAIGVVLAREVVGTDNDAAAVPTAVKLLKDDATLIVKNLERGDDLSTQPENLTYVSTSEVAFQVGERSRWVSLTVNLQVSIRDTLV